MLNYAYIDSNYHSAFSTIIMSSLCNFFKSTMTADEYTLCTNILEGSPHQGLIESLTHFIEGLIFMNNLYENYRQTANASYFWTHEPYIALTGNNQQDNILNLLRSNLSQEICKKL